MQVNKRGHKLQCSHYKPADTTAEHGRPIVVYCHCNSGSRRDAEEAFYALIPQDVTVFCLDFSVSLSFFSRSPAGLKERPLIGCWGGVGGTRAEVRAGGKYCVIEEAI